MVFLWHYKADLFHMFQHILCIAAFILTTCSAAPGLSLIGITTEDGKSIRLTYRNTLAGPFFTNSLKFASNCTSENGNGELIQAVPLDKLIKSDKTFFFNHVNPNCAIDKLTNDSDFSIRFTLFNSPIGKDTSVLCKGDENPLFHSEVLLQFSTKDSKVSIAMPYYDGALFDYEKPVSVPQNEWPLSLSVCHTSDKLQPILTKGQDEHCTTPKDMMTPSWNFIFFNDSSLVLSIPPSQNIFAFTDGNSELIEASKDPEKKQDLFIFNTTSLRFIGLLTCDNGKTNCHVYNGIPFSLPIDLPVKSPARYYRSVFVFTLTEILSGSDAKGISTYFGRCVDTGEVVRRVETPLSSYNDIRDDFETYCKAKKHEIDSVSLNFTEVTFKFTNELSFTLALNTSTDISPALSFDFVLFAMEEISSGHIWKVCTRRALGCIAQAMKQSDHIFVFVADPIDLNSSLCDITSGQRVAPAMVRNNVAATSSLVPSSTLYTEALPAIRAVMPLEFHNADDRRVPLEVDDVAVDFEEATQSLTADVKYTCTPEGGCRVICDGLENPNMPLALIARVIVVPSEKTGSSVTAHLYTDSTASQNSCPKELVRLKLYSSTGPISPMREGAVLSGSKATVTATARDNTTQLGHRFACELVWSGLQLGPRGAFSLQVRPGPLTAVPAHSDGEASGSATAIDVNAEYEWCAKPTDALVIRPDPWGLSNFRRLPAAWRGAALVQIPGGVLAYGLHPDTMLPFVAQRCLYHPDVYGKSDFRPNPFHVVPDSARPSIIDHANASDAYELWFDSAPSYDPAQFEQHRVCATDDPRKLRFAVNVTTVVVAQTLVSDGRPCPIQTQEGRREHGVWKPGMARVCPNMRTGSVQASALLNELEAACVNCTMLDPVTGEYRARVASFARMTRMQAPLIPTVLKEVCSGLCVDIFTMMIRFDTCERALSFVALNSELKTRIEAIHPASNVIVAVSHPEFHGRREDNPAQSRCPTKVFGYQPIDVWSQITTPKSHTALAVALTVVVFVGIALLIGFFTYRRRRRTQIPFELARLDAGPDDDEFAASPVYRPSSAAGGVSNRGARSPGNLFRSLFGRSTGFQRLNEAQGMPHVDADMDDLAPGSGGRLNIDDGATMDDPTRDRNQLL